MAFLWELAGVRTAGEGQGEECRGKSSELSPCRFSIRP